MLLAGTLRCPCRRYRKKISLMIKTRRGHSGPSRLRLKRQIKSKKQARSADDPYIFHPVVRTIEPVNQALRLTKSILNEGLPSVVETQTKHLPFDEILPQIKRTAVPEDYFDCEEKVKYGQRSKGFIANVVKAVWSSAASYPGLLRQTISYQPDLKVAWRRYGHNLQVSGRTGVLFSSTESFLPEFATQSEVNETEGIAVAKKDEIMSPVFELSQNRSRPVFDSGFVDEIFPFPRTLILTESTWNLPHLIAQGIMFSFGRLVERAVSRNKTNYGETLEHPLCMRSVVYNDSQIALLCYQLNTLDFENDEGVKNQLWLIPEIFIRCTNKPALEHSDSDPRVVMMDESELKTMIKILLYGEDVA